MAAWGGIGQWLPVVGGALALVPLTWPVYLGRRRLLVRRGVPVATARRFAVAEIGMVAGTVPWLWMILTPVAGGGRDLQPVPLVDLAGVLTGPALTAFFQVGGNLLVFVAFGFLAPWRWRVGPVAVTLLAAAGSVAVETSQYALSLGRVTSVDDVLQNAAGAGLAALLSLRYRPAPAAVDAGGRPGERPSSGEARPAPSSPEAWAGISPVNGTTERLSRVSRRRVRAERRKAV